MIQSWTDLELTHLFYAFRKAKADCFFERSVLVARRFAEYESELPSRLQALLHRLRLGQVDAVLADGLGEPRIVAKKLGLNAKALRTAKNNGHGFFSDPERAFERLCSAHELTPEFRIVGDFSVDMHLLSALWINLIGHGFDAKLDRSAYGARLRRYRPAPDAPKGTAGDYHIEAVGSFSPYFAPYKAWREGGLKAVRGELEAGRGAVALTMDLTSYYHKVDPSFLSAQGFQDQLGVQLNDWERSFTDAAAGALVKWSDRAAQTLTEFGSGRGKRLPVGGLPIGLSMVRIAANALLADFDRDVVEGLTPVYYGRYVDDIFLVLRDPGHLASAEELLQFIAARTRYFPAKASSSGEIRLKLPGNYWGRTDLVLQQSKQKAFFLEGRGGLDLLDNIESQIRSVSSERRLMPAPDRLEKMASAQVLTAAGSAAEEADTLRRADGLSVRRLGWSIQLRAVETLARDLRAGDWTSERDQFYAFAHNHVLRADRILDHIDYLPRLLSLAVALTDWPDARRLVDSAFAAVGQLQERTATGRVKINGLDASAAPEIWDELRRSLREAAADAVARSLRWSGSGGGMRPLPESAIRLCELVGLGTNTEAVEELSILLRESDWAKTPYKDHLRRDALRQRPAVDSEASLYELYTHENDLREFLNLSANCEAVLAASRVGPHCVSAGEGKTPSLLPHLLPTRPYTTQEVSLFLPNKCVFGEDPAHVAQQWARYVRAVRGVWVWVTPTEGAPVGEGGSSDVPPSDAAVAVIGRGRGQVRPRLGISSLLTTDDSFRKAASGTPDLSPERYKRLKIVLDQAITAKPRPTHLLLPELALPERWIDTVSGLLRDAGISLVAGVDYHINGPYIHSEAVLVLSDDRLGFPSTVQIRQPKALPAAGEEETLLKVFGKAWQPSVTERIKPVYVHQGLCFGVLVCSELQNIGHRRRFQGQVDCVMVLSWNQDLETFAALVESASLDVHAHIALVNNRRYGDSRVRSPAKAHHARDVCRLRGGENEHVVVVELEIERLRSFQSRYHRWPAADDPYKPTPEGFLVSKHRRTVPR